MSYQVLARKWRPKNFQQLMGQEHVVTVLTNALEQQRLHHAYLFTGTRGVGKTTIARIFAKSLNCQKGVTSTPCGTCDACVDIDQGRFVDLLEIDAASRTKVDDTREILDNVQYVPTRGRYKVYLIDEVHMLSRSSFNALLKTLEEPPEHVKFILATTDPQKLPITVLSRCLQFHLKALTVSQIEEKLVEILAAENVSHDQGALTLLAKAARGSMRDSLSLTDQAIAQGKGAISVANIQQMLGGIDQNWVYKILIALLKQDSIGLMKLSQEIASYAPNYSRLMAELIQLLHQVAMAQVVDKHFDLPSDHAVLLKKFCQAMTPEDVQLYYQIVLNGRKDLPYASDEQAAFDMVLLRLLAFKPMQNSDVSRSDTSDKNESVQHNNQSISFESDELGETQISQAGSSLVKNDNIVGSETDQRVEVDHLPNKTKDIDETFAIEPSVVPGEHKDPIALQDGLSSEMLAIEQKAVQQGFASYNEPVPQDEIVSPSAMVAEQVNSHENNEQLVPANNSQGQATGTYSEPPLQLPETAPPSEEYTSPVQAVLASRNMLRSRKKQLESAEKKSSDANKRQLTGQTVGAADSSDNSVNDNNAVSEESNPVDSRPSVPDIESIPSAGFSSEVIDPATIRKANQVDKWANMIDAMELGGRIRQLAIHATIDENSTDDLLLLKLDQATKHLNSDRAHKQLEASISEYLSRSIQVQVTIVEQTTADPYQIQSQINDKRLEYAKELIATDEIVTTFVQKFQADLDQDSITAL
ncbi:MAG: DNA polymerase III subunit gamma/tau [Alteromonadaceae bacterium]|nr:DNA polymerase III subunit gamma/tau [Alteromonadaceae bacterium]